jgi:chromosome segregation ATPase
MSAEPIKQGRSLFARKRDELDLGPSELETRVQIAEGRAEAAETRVEDIQTELMFYGDAIRSLKSELEAVTERVISRVAPQVVELEVRNAETDALRASVAAMRTDALTERQQLLEWRTDMEALVTSLHRDIETARRHIDHMPDLIRDALTPAAEAMANVGTGMSRLTALSVPSTALSTSEVAATTEPPEAADEPAGASEQEVRWDDTNGGEPSAPFSHNFDKTMDSLAWE